MPKLAGPMKSSADSGRSGRSSIPAGLGLGVILFAGLLAFFDPDPGQPVVGGMAAIAASMAIWWITEAVPLAATSLLPFVLFPLLGIMGIPLSLSLLIIAWVVLTRFLYPPDPAIRIDRQQLRSQYLALGPMKREEKLVATLFAITAFLWVFRVDIEFGAFRLPGWSRFFHQPSFIDDGTVAF
jgi:di/tricarboxylate transporter